MKKCGNALCTVRITPNAKRKLEIIAERKETSLGDAVSRIIAHYVANNLDYEVSRVDAYKAILEKLTGMDIRFSKVVGSTERTEDFIKSLVREGRQDSSSQPVPPYLQDSFPASAPSPSDGASVQALELLGGLLALAKPSTDYDGRSVMQMRLAQDDFLRVKMEYEQLCTSRDI